MEIPSSLNFEQCSSEAAAAYKAQVMASFGPVGKVADLTGGLGVDSSAFAKVADSVLYVERDAVLADAAARNFRVLADGNGGWCSNIDVKCALSDRDFVAALSHQDWIFLDPARRSESGRKVFLLEDCSPNVVELLPVLLSAADRVMLKLSPMADITMLRSRLGPSLRQVHIVGAAGECKELLCVLEGSAAGPLPFAASPVTMGSVAEDSLPGGGEPEIIVHDVHGGQFRFFPSENARHDVIWAESVEVGMELWEPDAVMMKAACHPLICSRLGLKKFSLESHLFVREVVSGEMTSPDGDGLSLSISGRMPENDGRQSGAAKLGCGLFKVFRIVDVLPFGKQGFKAVGSAYPVADVSARGIPMSSEELASRLKVRPGGNVHIFGAVLCGERVLVVAVRT